jgi:DNA polymerase
MLNLMDVGVDFETYYDGDYSLKKMQNAQYVMDARFEVMGVSIKFESMPAVFVTGTFDEIKEALSKIPWHKARLVAHNARFDGSILEWRFGFKPAAYLCTMVGSRPHFVPKTGSAALDSIGQHLKLQAKGTMVGKMVGKHLTDLTPEEIRDYGTYCCGDTEISYGIRDQLMVVLPAEEQRLIDLTIKKYLRPRLMLDGAKLIARIHELDRERGELLRTIEQRYSVTEKQLRSRDQFAKVLADRGVTIPMKTNDKGTLTYAFAKDDLGFKDLLVHQDPAVRELCNAKLTMSSSLEQARLSRLLDLHNTMNGMLPVPLVYYGAHPGRFSGDEKINLQNLPRVEWHKDKVTLKKGHLRFAVKAQPGYKIITADYMNIEARIVATLAGQTDLIEAFRTGRDVYSEFATEIYGYPVNKKDHPLERFVGKTCILGLGYGMGWKKFQHKMATEGVIFTDQEARRIVALYRSKYPGIPALWKALDQLAGKFLIDPTGLYVWKGITFAHERIILPNGMPIQYPDIASGPKGLYFRSRKYRALDADGEDAKLSWEDGAKIWGGHFLENIAQGLARIVAVRDELTLTDMGLPPALQVHDELVFHVPEQCLEICEGAIVKVMSRSLDCLPDLPIGVEVGHGDSYGNAK